METFRRSTPSSVGQEGKDRNQKILYILPRRLLFFDIFQIPATWLTARLRSSRSLAITPSKPRCRGNSLSDPTCRISATPGTNQPGRRALATIQWTFPVKRTDSGTYRDLIVLVSGLVWGHCCLVTTLSQMGAQPKLYFKGILFNVGDKTGKCCLFIHGPTVWKVADRQGIEPATFCSESAAITTAPRDPAPKTQVHWHVSVLPSNPAGYGSAADVGVIYPFSGRSSFQKRWSNARAW